jgi:zona occludens toxin (predicted ATPase)
MYTLTAPPQLSVGGREMGLTGRTAWGSNKVAYFIHLIEAIFSYSVYLSYVIC